MDSSMWYFFFMFSRISGVVFFSPENGPPGAERTMAKASEMMMKMVGMRLRNRRKVKRIMGTLCPG